MGFVALALVQSLHRFLTVEYGSADKHWDVWMVWEPLAETVLRGGRLYLGDAVDNKPPLFELLNVAVAATGKYYPVFLFLVGIANAVTAVLLWRFLRRRGRGREGVVAGILFLTALPLIDGTAVNVRSFALVGILAAIQVRSPYTKGVMAAIAGLFSQYSLLAVPVLVYDGRCEETENGPGVWSMQFVLAGCSVAIISFGIVAALWGPRAGIAGLEQSFGSFVGYSTKQGATIRSPLANPLLWVGYVYDITIRIAFVVIPAAVGVVAVAPEVARKREWDLKPLLLALAVGLSLSIFVRALPFYWVLPLPFYAALAALELRSWYSRIEHV